MSNVNLFSGRSARPDEPTPVQARTWRTWSKPLAIVVAGLFSIFILFIGFLVGNILGDIARDIAQRNSLPVVTTELRLERDSTALTANPPADQAAASPNVNKVEASPLALLPVRQVNILLLGSDERVSDGEPPRTDTMLLLTLDLERNTAGMISLTRDLWLPIPGYSLTTKINTAYAKGEQSDPGGGAQLAMDTVSSFIGQPVHYYVQADFSGFVRFIDEIDGVSVDVRQTIHDPEYPTLDFGFQTFHLEAGRQHLDGETALKYARTRNMDSDYGRAARQQQLLRAVVDKVLAADMIPTLIARAPQLMKTMWGSVSTDMPLTKAAEIANHVRSNSFEVRQLVIDNRYGEETYSHNGAWILLPDRDLIRPALRQFFDPAASPAMNTQASSGPRPASQSLPPSRAGLLVAEGSLSNSRTNDRVLAAREARLEILNGTGRHGIAAHMRQELEAKGWQVDSIGDADRSDYQRTILVNYNTDESLVREIGLQLNLSTSVYSLPGLLIPETTDLRIVIGEDYLARIADDSQ